MKIIKKVFAQPDVIGQVKPPDWLEAHGDVGVGQGGTFGLISFLNNALRLATVIAGLYGMLNLVLAGYGFISGGGNPENIQNAQDKIWKTLIGLVLIAASYTLAAIIGWLLFGDASIIIRPKVYGPGLK